MRCCQNIFTKMSYERSERKSNFTLLIAITFEILFEIIQNVMNE